MSTFGKLVFNEGTGKWVIFDLMPHVAMALKRLFPRIRQDAVTIELDDSDEIRADLEWFMLRYPLEHRYRKAMALGAQRIAHRMAERGKILLPTWEPQGLDDFREGYPPYKYQAQAAAVCLNHGALLLGDDVGLGKTVSAIATAVMGAPLPAAFVVEPHLAIQWGRQINKFTRLRAHVVHGRKPYNLPSADIYVFRYSNIDGWIDLFKDIKFPFVCWDEIQQLRHGLETSKGRASAQLRDYAEVAMGLSATPIYNYGDEMFDVMSFIKPGLLGSREEFKQEWCGGGRIVTNPDALGSYLRHTGFYLRRDEHDEAVQGSMPEPNVLDFEVQPADDDIADEEALMQQLALRVMNGKFNEAGNAARELDIRMRQLTGIAKARAVAAYVKMLLQDNERVLLAGWHREVYDRWGKALRQFNPVLYTGSETSAAKDRAVTSFCERDSRVMMLSLRSGAGLDGLQHHCKTVVFGELDWSPQVHKQIIGRLRRPGQSEQVDAHYVWTNWGSDPVIMDLLGVKSDQARGINSPGQAMPAKHTEESRIKKLAQAILETRR